MLEKTNTEIAAGYYSTVFETTEENMVYVHSFEFLKYEFINLFSKMHNVDLCLSEKTIISEGNIDTDDDEEISFFMKKLYTRDFSEEEYDEIHWLEDISQTEMFYEDMLYFIKESVTTKIGQSFAKSLETVIKFHDTFHNGYSCLDFHIDQVLFDENDNCYILDMMN